MGTRLRQLISGVAVLVLAGGLLPAAASAGPPPRVVSVGAAAVRAVELGISMKDLTLIRFEMGDVSMVAVGDPALVSVTVRGPDVLVRALVSSGSTNAFIWVGGEYTQWRFIVRESARDTRVVLVREAPAPAAAEPGRAAAAPTPPAVTGAPAAGEQVTVRARREAVPDPVKREEARAPRLDDFIKGLNARQRELFIRFAMEPTMANLQALLAVLSERQRAELLALINGGRRDGRGLAAPQAPPEARQPERQPAQPARPGEPVAPPAVAAAVSVDAPEGVMFSLIPQVAGGRVYLKYVLQNRGELTVLADHMRLTVTDGEGNNLSFMITRSGTGFIGRLPPGGSEAGVIEVEAAARTLVLTWELVGIPNGVRQLLRVRVTLPL